MSALAHFLQRERVLYTGRTHTTGGREHGAARSSDGALDIRFSPSGSDRPGANPEQMLAAGWSACFEGALGLAVKRQKIGQRVAPAITAEIDLKHGEDGYFLSARLNVSLPGLDRDVAQALVDQAQLIWPFSKALKGGTDITVTLV